MGKCIICDKEYNELYECKTCGELVCENCVMTYNQFTQIDYTLCKNCGEAHNDAMADEYMYELEQQKQLEKDKKIKNEKQRIYYHSEKAIKKRIFKKIEKEKLKIEKIKQRHENIKQILNNILK